MDNISLLTKLGEYRYMRRLYDLGELYLRPIAEFCHMDEADGIGDAYENVASFRCPSNPMITMKFPWGDFILPSSSRVTYAEHLGSGGLVYSMSIVDWSIDDSGNARIVDPDMLNRIGRDYDTLIAVTDCKRFVERVLAAAAARGFVMKAAPVQYYPEKDCIRDDLTPFYKRERYAYQREFRFFMECDEMSPVMLHVGSLADIAVICRAQPKER